MADNSDARQHGSSPPEKHFGSEPGAAGTPLNKDEDEQRQADVKQDQERMADQGKNKAGNDEEDEFDMDTLGGKVNRVESDKNRPGKDAEE